MNVYCWYLFVKEPFPASGVARAFPEDKIEEENGEKMRKNGRKLVKN